jgi:uncharacterized membrane protein (UPF0127 family)
MPPNQSQLVDAATGRVLIQRLELATTFWQRFRGWQCRRLPRQGTGILIAPCSSVHTCWMRFAIDIAFLDCHGTVLKIAPDVHPWRAIFKVPHASAILETPSGRCPLTLGVRVRISRLAATCMTPLLQAWVS